MIKKIYINRLGGHVNQYLANLVINKQIPNWDKNNLCKYKKIYSSSKAWVLLKFEFDFPILQQFMPFIEAKTNPINN